MLFVQDQDGEYRPAPKKLVLTEANKLIGYQLRRGALILSAETAKTVIGYKLRAKQHEVFACLFLDCQHRVLAFKEMFIRFNQSYNGPSPGSRQRGSAAQCRRQSSWPTTIRQEVQAKYAGYCAYQNPERYPEDHRCADS